MAQPLEPFRLDGDRDDSRGAGRRLPGQHLVDPIETPGHLGIEGCEIRKRLGKVDRVKLARAGLPSIEGRHQGRRLVDEILPACFLPAYLVALGGCGMPRIA